MDLALILTGSEQQQHDMVPFAFHPPPFPFARLFTLLPLLSPFSASFSKSNPDQSCFVFHPEAMTLLLLPLLFAVLTRQCHGMTADNNTKDNNPSALCTADSFICQGNCIPPEWVADGEPDCEDGSDERPMEVNGTTPASSPPGAEVS
jgi:hypothetical protein